MTTMREEAKAIIERKRDKYLKVTIPPMLFEAMKHSAKLGRRTLHEEIIFQLLRAYDKPQEQSNIAKLMTLR